MKQLLITDIEDKPFLTIPIDLPDNMTPEETDTFKQLVLTGIRDALFKYGMKKKQER